MIPALSSPLAWAGKTAMGPLLGSKLFWDVIVGIVLLVLLYKGWMHVEALGAYKVQAHQQAKELAQAEADKKAAVAQATIDTTAAGKNAVQAERLKTVYQGLYEEARNAKVNLDCTASADFAGVWNRARPSAQLGPEPAPPAR